MRDDPALLLSFGEEPCGHFPQMHGRAVCAPPYRSRPLACTSARSAVRSLRPPSERPPPPRPLNGLLRFHRSGAGLSALSRSSSTASGDSRSCAVVITSLSPEQTSPEALRALGL